MSQDSPFFDYLIDLRLADDAGQMRRLIDDMDLRIKRQQQRVEKIILNREGPADEMRALLKDMIDVRDLMHANLDSV